MHFSHGTIITYPNLNVPFLIEIGDGLAELAVDVRGFFQRGVCSLWHLVTF